MGDVNQVMLVGRIGKDVEIQKKGDKSFCRIAIATNYKPKDKEEITDWHTVVAFNGLSVVCVKNLKKGQKVFVSGRLATSKYEKNGENRYSTDIIADNIQWM